VGNKKKLSIARQAALLVFLGALVFVVYAATLEGPFLFDDTVVVRDNLRIHLTTFSPGDIIAAAILPRPFGYLSFALNHYFHQQRVFGYHLVNILIHIATAVFLYLFVQATLMTPALKQRFEHYIWTPFVCALIWAVQALPAPA